MEQREVPDRIHDEVVALERLKSRTQAEHNRLEALYDEWGY